MLLTQAKHISTSPLKIISLVPSQTELLHYLGLDKEVIGTTKFCVHPAEWYKTKTKIGGTKNLNIDLIRKLNPTLIIANKEENVKEQVELLAAEFTIWLTDVNNFKDALAMIADIGELTNKINQAVKLIKKIEKEFFELHIPDKKINTAYLIWKNPYMIAGGNTFINSIMQKCGLQNIFAEEERYPVITIQQLLDKKCQLLLLSTEPYPFKQIHSEELQQYLPHTKIVLVDGEMFSWYGSRLIFAPQYFKKLLNQLHSSS